MESDRTLHSDTADAPAKPTGNESGQVFAVEAHGICKRFETKEAVSDVSLQVPVGQFFGLVGPNGAGKTTLLRTLTGLLRPNEGTASVMGDQIWPDPTVARKHMGVLPDDLHLFERLSGRELLAYVGLLRQIAPSEVARRSEQLLSVLGFGASSDALVADYSTGMRKKIGLAAAMIHAPKIVFLDEPFESVDPVSVRVLQDVLRSYQRAGGTVVLSSHVMTTVESLCSNVAIMKGGQIVTTGTVEQVRDGRTLEEVFLETIAGTTNVGDRSLEWFHKNVEVSA